MSDDETTMANIGTHLNGRNSSKDSALEQKQLTKRREELKKFKTWINKITKWVGKDLDIPRFNKYDKQCIILELFKSDDWKKVIRSVDFKMRAYGYYSDCVVFILIDRTTVNVLKSEYGALYHTAYDIYETYTYNKNLEKFETWVNKITKWLGKNIHIELPNNTCSDDICHIMYELFKSNDWKKVVKCVEYDLGISDYATVIFILIDDTKIHVDNNTELFDIAHDIYETFKRRKIFEKYEIWVSKIIQWVGKDVSVGQPNRSICENQCRTIYELFKSDDWKKVVICIKYTFDTFNVGATHVTHKVIIFILMDNTEILVYDSNKELFDIAYGLYVSYKRTKKLEEHEGLISKITKWIGKDAHVVPCRSSWSDNDYSYNIFLIMFNLFQADDWKKVVKSIYIHNHCSKIIPC